MGLYIIYAWYIMGVWGVYDGVCIRGLVGLYGREALWVMEFDKNSQKVG